MAEGKKSFVLYADYEENFDMLSDEQAGKLIKHLLAYVNDKDPVCEDALINMAALPMVKQMKRDLTKWESIKLKRSEAGRKGGQKRAKNSSKQANASFAKQIQTNQAVTDTVTVTVTDTVNVESKLSDARAYKIILNEKPTEIEAFAMQNQALLKNKIEYKKLVESFDDKMLIELSQNKIEFEADQLMPRFRSYARNWLENNKNSNRNPEPESYEGGKNERF